jgi:hypothetical protein
MDAGLRAPEGPGQRFEPGCGACLVQAVCLVQALGLVQGGIKLVPHDV